MPGPRIRIVIDGAVQAVRGRLFKPPAFKGGPNLGDPPVTDFGDDGMRWSPPRGAADEIRTLP
jgi:hypothetical protein